VKSFVSLICLLLILMSLPPPRSLSEAAEPPAALTVREFGVYLYARQDEYSDKITALQKGEALAPLAEAVGKETWYLVQTKQGLSGWVRASDVAVSQQVKETFKEQNVSASTWTALTSNGRTFEGTWTVERSPLPDKAAGTWTLRETQGKTSLRGIWSAQKFTSGWSGTWRAMVEGQKTEYTGSWTADFSQGREARISELFEAAARDAIRGVWSAGNLSGSWSIRAAK